VTLENEFVFTEFQGLGLEPGGMPVFPFTMLNNHLSRSIVEIENRVRPGGAHSAQLKITGDDPTAMATKSLGLNATPAASHIAPTRWMRHHLQDRTPGLCGRQYLRRRNHQRWAQLKRTIPCLRAATAVCLTLARPSAGRRRVRRRFVATLVVTSGRSAYGHVHPAGAEYLDRVLCAVSTVSASQVIGRAVQVTPPADAFGVLRE
jgi:hypothetical protein